MIARREECARRYGVRVSQQPKVELVRDQGSRIVVARQTYFEARLHTDDQVELSDAYRVTEALVHFPMSHYGLFFSCDCAASSGTY